MAKGVKLSVKIALDVVMLLILVLLYKAKVLTLVYHEVAGIGILLVFLIHCLFNRSWIAANATKLFRSDASARTKFSYWISIALVVSFLVIVISGIFISKVLFRDQIEALNMDTSVFRTLHLFFSALSLILVGIHLGLYWPMVKGFFHKKWNISIAAAKPVSYTLLIIIVIFGAYSVPTSGFSEWLLCPLVPIEHHAHGDESKKGTDRDTIERTRVDSDDFADLEETDDKQAEEHAQRGIHDGNENVGDEQAGSNARQNDKSQSNERTVEGEGDERSRNHGNNIELSNVFLTIGQFTSIIGLFAAITYYINEALRRHKTSQK